MTDDQQQAAVDGMRPFLDSIPPHMRAGVITYVVGGHRPGDFLQAALANELASAVHRADPANLAALRAWSELLMWGLPTEAWGSREKVEAWIRRGGVVGNKTLVALGQGQYERRITEGDVR